jgi:hypothetical protein
MEKAFLCTRTRNLRRLRKHLRIVQSADSVAFRGHDQRGGVTGMVRGWASGDHQVIWQGIGLPPLAASQAKTSPTHYQVAMGK